VDAFRINYAYFKICCVSPQETYKHLPKHPMPRQMGRTEFYLTSETNEAWLDKSDDRKDVLSNQP
jgi:hypothetical protein